MCPFSKAYNKIYIAGEWVSEWTSRKKMRANELPGIKSINSNNELVTTNSKSLKYTACAHDLQIWNKSLNTLYCECVDTHFFCLKKTYL